MSLDADVWGSVFNDLIPRPTRPAGGRPVVGLRLCAVNEDGRNIALASYGAGAYRWRPGVNHASCPSATRRGPLLRRAGYSYQHIAPMRECACGFYAGTDLAKLLRILGAPEGDVVLCGIQAWGKLVVHEWGFRAQHARIVAISDQLPSRVLRDIDGAIIEVRAKRGVERVVAEYLAKRYRARLIDLAGMPGLLSKFGDFVRPEEG